jgi:hypothetical protein
MPDQTKTNPEPKPKPKLRWYQFSLRSLLLLVTLFACFMSWFTVKMHQAKKQKEIVELLIDKQNNFRYDYQIDSSGNVFDDAKPFAPEWLVNWLGIDFFANVVSIDQFGKGFRPGVIEDLVYLPKLKELRFSTNIDDKDLEYIGKLKSLEFLDISSFEISSYGIDKLKNLPKLKRLNLWNAYMSDAEMEPLRKLTCIEHLDLGGDQLTDETLVNLESMKELQYLYIMFDHFNGTGLRYLKGLDHLQELIIESKDKMIGAELDHLVDLPKLESLEIRNSQLTDDSLSHFKRLTQLKVLKLYSDKISEEGISKLKNDLLNTTINDPERVGGSGGGMGMGF